MARKRGITVDDVADAAVAVAGARGPEGLSLDALEEAGVPAGDRIHMARAVRSALHGFVELERGSGFGMPESVEESFERLVDLLLSGVGALAEGGAAGEAARRRQRS